VRRGVRQQEVLMAFELGEQRICGHSGLFSASRHECEALSSFGLGDSVEKGGCCEQE
jgi:hypothetical protein